MTSVNEIDVNAINDRVPVYISRRHHEMLKKIADKHSRKLKAQLELWIEQEKVL